MNIKCKNDSRIGIFATLIIWAALDSAIICHGATLYKRYIVANNDGQDILCEPYIVQENDYVIKLFKQKGEIAHQDFPEFLDIFSQINAQITDINTIHSGQNILIPLKKIAPGSFPDQKTGIVDIPFITISTIPNILKQHGRTHKVKKNDVLSKLIARHYGGYGTKSYKQGVEIFKALNPHIRDINTIYEGQELILPDESLRNELYYSALFDSSGRLKTKHADLDTVENEGDPLPEKEALPPQESPYKKIARALNLDVKENGIYFLPQENGPQIKLDLSKNPMIEKPNGEKILFVSRSMGEAEKQAIQNVWPDIQMTRSSPGDSLDAVLTALTAPSPDGELKNAFSFPDMNSVVTIKAQWVFDTPGKIPEEDRKTCLFIIQHPSEKTPEMIKTYLKEKKITINDILHYKDRPFTRNDDKLYRSKIGDESFISYKDNKTFVNDLVIALDLYYAQNISITFPYSGIQIKAFASLISTGDGRELLVDFANLYGDAFQAITASGFDIISIKPHTAMPVIIETILNTMDIPYQYAPTFKAAQRLNKENVYIHVKNGYYIHRKNGREYLLLMSPIPPELSRFIQNKGITLIWIEE